MSPKYADEMTNIVDPDQTVKQMSRDMTKQTKWVCAQRLRSGWASSLSAWRKIGSLATHLAHSKDFDQIGRMPRLIWVFAWRTPTLLFLSCCGSNVGSLWSYDRLISSVDRLKDMGLYSMFLQGDMAYWIDIKFDNKKTEAFGSIRMSKSDRVLTVYVLAGLLSLELAKSRFSYLYFLREDYI